MEEEEESVATPGRLGTVGYYWMQHLLVVPTLPSPPLPSPPLVLPPENMFSLTQGKDKNTFMPVVVHAEGHVRQYMKRDINMLR